MCNFEKEKYPTTVILCGRGRKWWTAETVPFYHWKNSWPCRVLINDLTTGFKPGDVVTFIGDSEKLDFAPTEIVVSGEEAKREYLHRHAEQKIAYYEHYIYQPYTCMENTMDSKERWAKEAAADFDDLLERFENAYIRRRILQREREETEQERAARMEAIEQDLAQKVETELIRQHFPLKK